jgi:hypothetical protein
MEIFKYGYNIIFLRKIKKIINLFIPLLFKDFVIFVRDSQISTQIDLPANYSTCTRVHTYMTSHIYMYCSD